MNNLNAGRWQHLTDSLEPRYLKWHDMKSLNREIEQTMFDEEDLLIVEGVPRVIISRILREPKMGFSWPVNIRRYYADEQRLVLNVCNHYQTEISEHLDLVIRNSLGPKFEDFFTAFRSSSTGAAMTAASNQATQRWVKHSPRINQTNGGASLLHRGEPANEYRGGDLGQADCARRPATRQAADWPTLVIESGFTAHMRELEKHMPWWFKASDHAVKIVLLAKIDYRRKILTIEHWEEDDYKDIARDHNKRCYRPVKRNTVSIRLISGANGSVENWVNPNFQIEGTPLILKSQKLFDREPGEEDKDGVITARDLEFYMTGIFC